ncbi:hypothetical protein GCM10009716_46090 [Streptomyces sodiiphilus]|uniref:Uncharacterized protein n=2 Tax=Streptomyces sodiiphilus TaxID=226217 RepID=A0ABP5B829_9ACTN
MDTRLAEELLDMATRDHRVTHYANSENVDELLAWHLLTARNGDRLGQIMHQYGWPTFALVGREAARGAWLIAQHADRQLDVQRRALQLMERAAAQDQASARDLAFLRDRVLVNEGRRQMYGTQIAGMCDGVPVLWPCEDLGRAEQLRAEAGIEPSALYADRLTAH